MKVMNLMLSQGRGGIEQAFVNSAHGIQDLSGFDQLCIVDQNSTVTDQLDFPVQAIRQFADWDLLAIYQLYKITHDFNPDIILCHGNRPLKMMLWIKAVVGLGKAKLVGFCHNFSIRHLLKADAIISVSKNILDTHILASGFPENRTFHIPNMIDLKDFPPLPQKPRSEPVVIGAMGRFVAKKGFEDYLYALKILVDRGLNIKAVLGGHGDQESYLKSLARKLSLGNNLRFIGWVHDKKQFYQEIDLFCLPSREEPFGIIALETLAFGIPMVATRTSGPCEFLIDGKNSILCNHSNPTDLANAIERAINLSTERLSHLVQNGMETVAPYDSRTVSQNIIDALQKIQNF